MAARYPLSRLLEIEWMDSHGSGPEWRSVDALKEWSRAGPMLSVGYLVDCTKTHLLIAASQSSASEQCSDATAIPLKAILRKRAIKSWARR